MNKPPLLHACIIVLMLWGCQGSETATGILQKAIQATDTIETVYYKQDMVRTDPRNSVDTIFRYREMYFKRLASDSLVGAKGHWYMYTDDKVKPAYEDIYDGSRLVRKNNLDSAARVYDLLEHPEFRGTRFWGHNTPWGMQHEFRHILANTGPYTIERLKDTIFQDRPCFQLRVVLKDKVTMPGFAAGLEDSDGSISNTLYVIDKGTYYPLRMKAAHYSAGSPGRRTFMDQRYYDIKFNLSIDEALMFDTSDGSLAGFTAEEMMP